MLFSFSTEQNAMPPCLKSLTKEKIHYTYSFSMLHKASYPVREVNEVGLIWSALDKPKLSVSFQLIMLERIENWLLIIYLSKCQCNATLSTNPQIPVCHFSKLFTFIYLSSGLWDLTILSELLKTITNGLEAVLASSLSTSGWVSSGSLNSSDIFKYPALSLLFPLFLSSCSS